MPHSLLHLLFPSFPSINITITIYKSIILSVVLYVCVKHGIWQWGKNTDWGSSENRVLKKLFGPKRDEEIGEWRRLHYKELYGLYSSVGIATRYGLGARGSNPGGGKIFRGRPDRPWGLPNLLYNGYSVSFPGVKRSRNGVNHPLPLAQTLSFFLLTIYCCDDQIKKNEPGMWHASGSMDVHTGFWWRDLKVGDHLQRPRRRWVDNIKIDLKLIGTA